MFEKTTRKDFYQTKLVKAINSCGVTFEIWRKPDENGNLTNKYDWTSLMGTDKKRLLERLPDTFADFLNPVTIDTVTKIWKDFHDLYGVINTWSPSEEQIDNFFGQAKEWVNLFLSLSGIELGYGKESITPYIHIMCYHMPLFLSTCGIKCFTGQGVEKTNDVIRRLYHLKSNKYDSCKDGLLAVKRLNELQDFDRQPREYQHHNTGYWKDGIREERNKRQHLSVIPRDDNGIDIDKLSEKELQYALKDKGIKTRVRNVDKLRQILKDANYAALSSSSG